MLLKLPFSEPGPPSDVQIYPFGEYLLVKWTPPKEPNGIITNYQVGSAEFNGSSPENVVVAMETVEASIRQQLLGSQKFETSYVVELRARTSKGWGASFRTTTRTIKRSGEGFNTKLHNYLQPRNKSLRYPSQAVGKQGSNSCSRLAC